EAALRLRPDRGAWLLVEFAVAFDVAAAQRLQDHRGRLVEALARFVHRNRSAEGGEFAARQTAADAETEALLGEVVEHRDLLGDAQRVVPRQYHRRGAEIGMAGDAGQIAHQLQVIRAERIV